MDVLLKANGHWAQVDAGVVTIDDVEDEDEDEDNQWSAMENADMEDCTSVQDAAFPVTGLGSREAATHKHVIVTMSWKLKLVLHFRRI